MFLLFLFALDILTSFISFRYELIFALFGVQEDALALSLDLDPLRRVGDLWPRGICSNGIQHIYLIAFLNK